MRRDRGASDPRQPSRGPDERAEERWGDLLWMHRKRSGASSNLARLRCRSTVARGNGRSQLQKEGRMAQQSNEEIVRAYIAAHRAHDYDSVGTMRHREWVTEWPQSGERVKGNANDRAIMDNWPEGLPEASDVRVVGSE